MKHYLEESSVVLQDLQSGANGLTEQEAAARLEKNGKNKLVEGKKESLIHRFFKQLAEPMTIILIVAAIMRKNKIIYPRGDDTIEAGDRVIVVTRQSNLTNLDDILR